MLKRKVVEVDLNKSECDVKSMKNLPINQTTNFSKHIKCKIIRYSPLNRVVIKLTFKKFTSIFYAKFDDNSQTMPSTIQNFDLSSHLIFLVRSRSPAVSGFLSQDSKSFFPSIFKAENSSKIHYSLLDKKFYWPNTSKAIEYKNFELQNFSKNVLVYKNVNGDSPSGLSYRVFSKIIVFLNNNKLYLMPHSA